MGTDQEQLVESIVTLPIINPDTGGHSRKLRFAGKVDLFGSSKLCDYKGVSDPKRYITLNTIGFQLDLYALCLRAKGHQVDEVEYRIVGVPKIKLCGKDASPEAYEDRCVEWLTDPSHPSRMISHPFVVTDDRLQQARYWLWNSCQRVLENRRTNRWLPNALACFTWERACEYLPLCELVRSGQSAEREAIESYDDDGPIHPELGEAGRDCGIATHSSMSTLTLCEMKYYWRYERGLRERNDYAESRWIGSAMHAGLEGFASDGLNGGREAIGTWREKNPVLGEDSAHKEDQDASKAMAMVRAAAIKWGEE